MRKSEILNTIELRQSTVKDYLSCPLMFHFKHLEGIAPAWRHSAALHGSALHKLIYLMHDSKWHISVKRYYREIFEYYEFQKAGDCETPVYWENREKELAAYEANASEIIEGYRKRTDNREAIIHFAESEFRVKICGQVFTGTIDQIRENRDGTLELIDFKSSKMQPTLPFLFNDFQLNLYLYAARFGELKSGEAWVKPKLLPTYSSWYFLRAHEIRKRSTVNGNAGEEKIDNPLIRTEKGITELRHFRKEVSDLLKVMLKPWHFPNTNHCRICSYTRHCMDRHRNISEDILVAAQKLLKEVA